MENPAGQRLLVAVPSPFAEDGTVDTAAATRLAQFLATTQVDGAFVAGTTGEFPALSVDERIGLFQAFHAGLAGRRLVGHIGAASTREATEILRRAREIEITEFAAITPYFLPADATETLRYYTEISAAMRPGERLYVYLFEARTGTHVSPAQLARILELPGVAGAKLSGMSLTEATTYRAALGPHAEVYTGADGDFAALLGTGLTGVVSGVSSVFPEPFDQLRKAITRKQDQLQPAQLVNEVVTAIAGDIGRIKTALAFRGLPVGPTRMPMTAIDSRTTAQLADLAAKFNTTGNDRK
jgi:4-hydroxy-tetrahydrodipicolinate synthase